METKILKDSPELFNTELVLLDFTEHSDEQNNTVAILQIRKDFETFKVRTGSRVILNQLQNISYPVEVIFVKKTAKSGYEYFKMEML